MFFMSSVQMSGGTCKGGFYHNKFQKRERHSIAVCKIITPTQTHQKPRRERGLLFRERKLTVVYGVANRRWRRYDPTCHSAL